MAPAATPASIIPHELAERLRERTRAMVGELIPDEAITEFVKNEVKAIFEVKSVKYVDGQLFDPQRSHFHANIEVRAGTFEELTPVQALIRTELRKKLVEHIGTELNKIQWDSNQAMPFVVAVTKELAPVLVETMFKGVVYETVRQMHPR